MKKLVTGMSIGAVILMAMLAVSFMPQNQVSAHETLAQTSENESNEEAAEANDNENYEYVAQPGDSYSQMARKALQTYGIETDGQIGAAGILFAETNIAHEAGWPMLNEGQTVTMSKESVKKWFDMAAKLTAEEKANWQYYVPFVDFNTNHVGE